MGAVISGRNTVVVLYSELYCAWDDREMGAVISGRNTVVVLYCEIPCEVRPVHWNRHVLLSCVLSYTTISEQHLLSLKKSRP